MWWALLACSGAAFSFMVVALFFFGSVQSGIACAYIDISPNYSNTMNSVGNAIGAVAGFAGPIVVSVLITSFEGRQGWQLSFYLTALMCIVSLVFWKIFQTSEVIPVLNTAVQYKKK
jgi:MFS family permease